MAYPGHLRGRRLTRAGGDASRSWRLIDRAKAYLDLRVNVPAGRTDSPASSSLPAGGWWSEAARDYEKPPRHSEALIMWPLINLMTRRLTRTRQKIRHLKDAPAPLAQAA